MTPGWLASFDNQLYCPHQSAPGQLLQMHSWHMTCIDQPSLPLLFIFTPTVAWCHAFPEIPPSQSHLTLVNACQCLSATGSPVECILQEERIECLWKAIERAIPDIRERANLVLPGSPITHQRYLNRCATSGVSHVGVGHLL